MRNEMMIDQRKELELNCLVDLNHNFKITSSKAFETLFYSILHKNMMV